MSEPKDDMPTRLRNHRVILKSGDYGGADIMRAWCTMMDAIKQARQALAATHDEFVTLPRLDDKA